MLRVMHLMGAAKPGGAEQFFLRLMIALAKRTGDIELLPVVRKGSWAALELEAAGIPFETAAFGGMFDLLTRLKMGRLAARFCPHVVQSWMNRATRFVPRGPWARVARLGGYYDMKYYRGNVDFMVGNTLDLVAYIRKEGWVADKVAYVPNFIPEPPAGWELAREEIRRELKIPPAAKLLLMAGRLHKVKGIDLALRALVGMKDAYLLLLGVGPEEVALKALAEELGVAPRVRWVGWQSSLSRYASAADMWLAPSRKEPLGNVVLDAWAHGVPMIASKTVGPASLMTDGVNGLLVGINDAEALGKAVARLIKNPALAVKLGEAGRSAFEADFCEDVVVDRWISYYLTICKG